MNIFNEDVITGGFNSECFCKDEAADLFSGRAGR